MKKINIKKVGIITTIIIVLVTFFQKCINDKLNVLEGEYNVLKENYENQKIFIDSLSFLRKKERDSLEFQIKQREVYNAFLNNENTSLKDKIVKLKNKPTIVPKDVKGLVDYFNERYEETNNVVIENKVALTEKTASNVTWDLEDYDKIVEVSTLQESVIKNQDTIIFNLNKDKVDLSLVISSAENEIQERKKLQEIAEENIMNLENQVKKQKRKNFWNKVMIVGGSVGGFLLGTQIK